MRIISKFRDFYDGVQGHGADMSLVYVRKNRQIRRAEQEVPLADQIHSFRPYAKDRIGVERKIVFFCGDAYVLSYVTAYKTHTLMSRLVLDISDVEKLAEECFSEKKDREDSVEYFVRTFFSNRLTGPYNVWRRKSRKKVNPEEVIDVLSPKVMTVPDDIFFEFGSPIILASGAERSSDVILDVDCSLEELDFQRILYPSTTYQKISMFIGGVLGEAHPPTLDISDADMKVAKGFGHKYAFKKEPTKRKK